jgi:glycosyltransferase involved in cell wall biosynthesis
VTRRIVIAANSAWNILNFRSGLILALKAAGYEPVVIAPVDPASEGRIAELGVERISIDIDRSGLNPIADFRLLLAYRKILRRLAPIVFLGFTVKPNIYGCIAARSLGIPAIANITGLGTAFIKSGPLTSLVTAMYRFALSRADVVFFENPDDRALFLEKKIVLTPQAQLIPGSGVDLERFAPAPLPSGPPKFLLIARLLGDKGIREYAAAAGILKADLPRAEFQLLGPLDKANRTAISRAELERWMAEGAIDYLGETNDVRPFIRRASVIVLPSYREGLPLSLLEGAAMARPLIATDVPGCRQLVVEKVTGLLCEARNPASLALAMKQFAQMPSRKRSEMGAAARSVVEQHFSKKIVVDAYIKTVGLVTAQMTERDR